MFVGEAPGRATRTSRACRSSAQAGKLLDKLLGEIGLAREDVFIANVLKCRPPGNRDPQPAEIENCQDYLLRQVELIEPRVICTLGNFATKLLRGDPTGITRLHGQRGDRVIGRPRAVRLYPLFHPAAALYTPLDARDAARGLRAAARRCWRWTRRRSPRPSARARARAGRPEPEPAEEPETPAWAKPGDVPEDPQLGLF